MHDFCVFLQIQTRKNIKHTMKLKTFITTMALATISLASTAQSQQRTGIDLANIDATVRPADDFFQYACGGWMQRNPLPPAYSRYGSFDALQEENNKRINGILSDLLQGSFTQGTIEQKLSDLYKLAMDSVRRNQDGTAPVMGIILQLEQARTNDQLFDIEMQLAPFGNMEFMRAGIGADEKNASQNIMQVSQGGLMLGMKDYYLDNDTETTKSAMLINSTLSECFNYSASAGVQHRKRCATSCE